MNSDLLQLIDNLIKYSIDIVRQEWSSACLYCDLSFCIKSRHVNVENVKKKKSKCDFGPEICSGEQHDITFLCKRC